MDLRSAIYIIERFSEMLDEKEAIRIPTTSSLHQACAFLVNWFRERRDLFNL